MILSMIVLIIGTVGFILGKKHRCVGLQKSFLVCIATAVIALATWNMESKESLISENAQLLRPEPGEGDYEAELVLDVEDMGEYSFVITVPEQHFTREEELFYLEAAVKEIEISFKGENTSLEKIREKVEISETYQNGRVNAEWNFSNARLIDEHGKINDAVLTEEGEDICATVMLTCGNSKLSHSFYFSVFSSEKSEKEKLDEKIYAYISEAGKNEKTKILQLPTEMEGRALSWENKESFLSAKILFLGVVVAVLLPELERERIREQKKKREEQLLREYPEMISKLTLLLGAGMTVMGAWTQITNRYLATMADGKISRNEVYEEMLITRREIESGKGELRSYQAFGERCGLPRFRKFSNYLVQNMKKGSLSICEILEKEVQEVYIERRSRAKRYGEEATTKLLFPMLLMLGIVIVIIMIPAVISFQIGI